MMNLFRSESQPLMRKRRLQLAQMLAHNLTALSSQSASQLNVFGLDGNTLSVNSSQICVFKERDQAKQNVSWIQSK